MTDVLAFLAGANASGVAVAQPVSAANPLPVALAGVAPATPLPVTLQGATLVPAGADGRPNAQPGYLAYSYPFVFNGVSWDRVTKPRTAYRLPISAASINAASIKAGPGTIYGLTGLITVSAPTGAYVKFFDTVAIPNPAIATPLYMFALTNNTGAIGFANFSLPSVGLYFPTGIGIAIVGGAADLDATPIAAGQVLGLNVPFA